jgi:calcineurin-like phosphoesterase family protein
MSKTFVLADTHFCHKNIHKFRRMADGTPFTSAEQHDEFLMDMWNTYIPGGSTVYVLGDAAFNEAGLMKFKKLHGNKFCIQGNHDPAMQTLAKYFHWVGAMKSKSIDGVHILMTHIPIHLSQMERWHLNIHGHTHMQQVDSPHHFNVSIEATNYIPMTIDSVIEEATKNVWFRRKEDE